MRNVFCTPMYLLRQSCSETWCVGLCDVLFGHKGVMAIFHFITSPPPSLGNSQRAPFFEGLPVGAKEEDSKWETLELGGVHCIMASPDNNSMTTQPASEGDFCPSEKTLLTRLLSKKIKNLSDRNWVWFGRSFNGIGFGVYSKYFPRSKWPKSVAPMIM